MAEVLENHPPLAEECRQPLRRLRDLDDVAADVAADQVGRFPLDEKAPLVHDDQPVAETGGLIHVVGRQQDREPLRPELLQTLPDLVARLGIEAGRRLVEDEELRPVEKRAGHHQTPDHPAGEVGRPGVFPVVEGHEPQQLPGAPRRLGRGDVEVAGEDLEVLKNGKVRIDVVLLLADADPGLHRARLPGDVEAQHPQRPPARRGEGVDHPDRGGLPRPVGTEDPEALPGVD